MPEWRVFCNLEEGKNLQDLRVQADTGSGEEHYFQVHIRLLQSDQNLFGKSRRAVAGCVQRVGESEREDRGIKRRPSNLTRRRAARRI